MAPDDSDDSGSGQDVSTYDPSQQGVLGNYMPPAWNVPAIGQPSIFGDVFNPKPWTPADNSLNVFVDPATMKTIDFDGADVPAQPGAQSQPSQPDASGFTGLTPWQPGSDAGGSVLNGHGYIPQSGDENQLVRIIYAEASNTPSDMPAIGWSVVNRVGDPEFGKTLDDVINQKNQFSSVQDKSKQWQGSADPDSLTGPNATAWQKAQDTAQGILGGAVPDPVDGGAYFYSSKPGGSVPPGFQSMLEKKTITPVSVPGGSGINHFLQTQLTWAQMTNRMLSQIARGAGFCLLLCATLPAAAKYPELGNAKQFDLFCQGHVEHVLDPYIPVPMAGPGGDIPKIQAVKRHIIVDLPSMHFEDVHEHNSSKDKIAQEKDGLLYLMNERGFRRWVINLDSYKSVYVMEEDSGDLWVEKMQCRPAKFSGIPAGLPEFPQGGGPSAAPWVFQKLIYENKIAPVSPEGGSGNLHFFKRNNP